ncbi:MAG: hypothetical protein MUO72_13715 [Bacteroidales bacterium]|nr:hypothetical protein [Bacteroidales bacterium]
MKTLKKIFLFLMLIFIFSCEKWGSVFIYCPDCLSDEPQKAYLEIKLSDNLYSLPVEVRIYEGNLEDSILYDTFQSTSNKVSVWVLINKKYTLTAKYFIPGNTSIVVNSVTPQVKYDEMQCKEPCYYIYNKVINLRLKYTN